MSGRQLLVPADGIVSVSPEDSGPMIAGGWTVSNNLEKSMSDIGGETDIAEIGRQGRF
jgi:hypothetical protein